MLYERVSVLHHLNKIGQYTLQVYILQVFVIETALTKAIDFTGMNIWLYSLVLCPILAVVSYCLCMFITKILEMNKGIDFILFGKRQWTKVIK
jgi:hypothetical protein